MKSNTIKIIFALSVIYFVVRIPWLLTLPMNEAPDELNHLWVTQFLVNHLRLPTANEVVASGLVAEYGSLPQFGYIPHAALVYLLKFEPITFVARLGSLFIGLITVWMAFFIGKDIFPKRALYAVALPALIIVHPQLVFVQSYVNTDSTTVSIASVIFFLLVRSFKGTFSVSHAVLIGILLGWLALSKHTGLSLVPAVIFSMALACLVHQLSLGDFLLRLIMSVIVFGATCGWWFVRNYYEFSGDWLGSRTMYETWSKILPRSGGQIIHPWPSIYTMRWWRYVFFDYWGLFGYMNRYLWRPTYFIYLALCIASAVGWFKDLRLHKFQTDYFRDSDKAIWLTFILCALCNLCAAIYVTLGNVSGPHGRYLFPSEIPILALLLAGYSRLPLRLGNACVLMTLLTGAITCVVAWLKYYPPLN